MWYLAHGIIWRTKMRTIAWMALAITLAGCGTDYSSGDNSGSENAAAWMLLGATAFSNGYTQSRPQPMLTCFRTGMMTQCQ